MIMRQLTGRAPAARYAARQGRQQAMRRSFGGTVGAMVMLAGGALAMSGCVSVSAPDKPIVIELNINIKQEVIYRLAADAGNTIDNNRDIF